MKKYKMYLFCVGILGVLMISLGAFAGHLLNDGFLPEQKRWFETALRYHSIHVPALLGCVLFAQYKPGVFLDWSIRFFFFGIVIFSGCLYAMAFGAPRWLGAVVPFGGLSFIAGWGAVSLFAVKEFRHNG